MKRLLFFALLLFFFTNCDNNDDIRDNNPNLIDPLVDLTLNLSLPQFNSLNFPNNTVIINSQGIKGILVYTPDAAQYFAFELSDPNHPPNSCSRMEVDGLEVFCPCEDDDNVYSLPLFGQHKTNPALFPMQQYNATRSGNVVRVTN